MELEFIRSKCCELMGNRTLEISASTIGRRSMHVPSTLFSTLYMRFLSPYTYGVPTLSVSSIEVNDKFRRKGHCTRLLTSIMQLATEQQYAVVVENVLVPHLISLLTKLGFTDIHDLLCTDEHPYGMPPSFIWFPNKAVRKRYTALRAIRLLGQRSTVVIDGDRVDLVGQVAKLRGCQEFVTAFHDIALEQNKFTAHQLEAVCV